MDRKLSHKAGLRFYFLLFLFFVEKILKSFLEYCLNLVKFLCVFNRAKICVAVCLFLNLEKDYFAVVLKTVGQGATPVPHARPESTVDVALGEGFTSVGQLPVGTRPLCPAPSTSPSS